MLDMSEVSTLNDLAAKERIARSYVARLLRLTTLAPFVVHEIVARERDCELDALLQAAAAADWVEQQQLLSTRDARMASHEENASDQAPNLGK